MTASRYLVISVQFEVPDGIDEQRAADQIAAELHYDVKYSDDDGVEIEHTEVVGFVEECTF